MRNDIFSTEKLRGCLSWAFINSRHELQDLIPGVVGNAISIDTVANNTDSF